MDSVAASAQGSQSVAHEYAKSGTTNGWRLDEVVPAAEIVRLVESEWPLEPVEANYRGEVASRYRYADGEGEIGVIASVTQPFCRDCTRARLSAEGELYTCLFASRGHDLRSLLRAGASDEEIAGRLSAIWTVRGDRYSEVRTAETARRPKVEMSHIGADSARATIPRRSPRPVGCQKSGPTWESAFSGTRTEF